MSDLPDSHWGGYNEYCSLRERGLRREAFRRLEAFISDLSGRAFLDRKAFVCWLFSENRDIRRFPHPLRVRIIEPLLQEWIAKDPLSSTPHLWLGTIPHLWEAYRLDPTSLEIRWRLVLEVLKVIQYEMHEFPIGFLGDDPEGSYATLLQLRRMLSPFPSSQEVDFFKHEIEEMIELLGNYIVYRRDPAIHEFESFQEWCERTGRVSE